MSEFPTAKFEWPHYRDDGRTLNRWHEYEEDPETTCCVICGWSIAVHTDAPMESPTPSPLPELARLEIYETIMDFRIVQRSGVECEDIASVPKLLHRDNRQRARAEQICASVNAHAALVEALKCVLREAGIDPDGSMNFTSPRHDLVVVAKALALAEPQK